MATIQEIIEYSKQNPNTDYAKQAWQKISSGAWNERARSEGVDLSFAGQPDFASELSFASGQKKPQVSDIRTTLTDPAAASVKEFSSGIRESADKRHQNVGVQREQFEEGEQGLARTALRTGGQAAGLIGDIGFETLKLLAPKRVEELAGKAAGAVAGTDVAQSLASEYDQLKQKYPEAVQDLEAVFNIGALLPVGAAGSAAAKGAGKATKAGKEGVQKVSKALERIAPASQTQSRVDDLDYAVELTMPKVTNKKAAEAIQQGRMTEPGVFKKARLEPTQRDNLVGESVADVVSSSKSVTENIDAIQQKLSQTNLNVREMIAENNIEFTESSLRKKVDGIKSENKLIFASDATAERVHDAVVEAFMDHVKTKPTKNLSTVDYKTGDFRSGPTVVNTLDLFEARQSFDKIPAIKKLLDTEGLGENTRRQIVLDIRRAANEYIAEQLPANNPYRTALMQESRMLEALGNIAEKNASQIGKSKLQMLLKEYPALNWVIGISAGGVGTAAVGQAISD